MTQKIIFKNILQNAWRFHFNYFTLMCNPIGETMKNLKKELKKLDTLDKFCLIAVVVCVVITIIMILI